MPEGKRQAHIRREVRRLEKAFREERTLEGRTPMGPTRLAKLDPRSRPRTKPARTRKAHLPLAPAPSAAREYRQEFKEFLTAYKAASAAYRSGAHDVEFPAGSFKPPLIYVAVPADT